MTYTEIIKTVILKEFSGEIEGNIDFLIPIVKQKHPYLFTGKYNITKKGFENSLEYEELYSCITGVLDELIRHNGYGIVEMDKL